MHNISEALQDRAEGALVKAAGDGSQEAFEELLRRSGTRLLRMAVGMLGSREEAEDEVQNACSKAYQHLSSFEGQSSFNTWLTSIVMNQCRMRLRQLRRSRLVSMDESAEDRAPLADALRDESPGPERMYAGSEMLRLLREEMRRLPLPLRQVMLLRHVEDLPTAQAAERLGISVLAAKTRLFRARRQLRMRIGRRFSPERAAA